MIFSSIRSYSTPRPLTDSDSQYASAWSEALRKRCQKYHVKKPAGHLWLDFNDGIIIQVGRQCLCLIYIVCVVNAVGYPTNVIIRNLCAYNSLDKTGIELW